ncbi:MAG TPA: hypothetical protein VKW06_07865 [Candidatus Angelobacter sp.]|nr:hypothetical protein [Candidatus Angelobacter sp.]
MRDRRQSVVNFRASARLTLRDFLLALTLLTGGGNLYWCWTHEQEIRALQQQHKAALQQKQFEAKNVTTERTEK